MARGKIKKERDLRIPLQILIEYQADNKKINMFCSNLSVGGVFVETTTSAPLGTKLKLSFTLPTEDTVFTIDSKVMWIRKADDGDAKAGMGLEFENVDEETKSLIVRAIAYLKDVIED